MSTAYYMSKWLWQPGIERPTNLGVEVSIKSGLVGRTFRCDYGPGGYHRMPSHPKTGTVQAAHVTQD
jgi:hypothetical protein